MQGRVLVIDDEKNITFVIQAMLERAGFEAIVFNDSVKALEALSTEDPNGFGDGFGDEFDLVITDLYMPGPSGMEVLEH